MTHPFLPEVESARLSLQSEQTSGNDMFLAAWRRT
jgi:hypothetical protein